MWRHTPLAEQPTKRPVLATRCCVPILSLSPPRHKTPSPNPKPVPRIPPLRSLSLPSPPSPQAVSNLCMVSEQPSSMATKANVVAEKPVARSFSNRKNQGKVPKKIHKAEREKMKRDYLNDLFLELGHTLEPARQNNGKASILSDATKLLQDLIAQVESLRKENAALVTESHYVFMEKNELKDENTGLVYEIEKLQNELQERLQSEPAWQSGTDAAPSTLAQPADAGQPMQQPPGLGPIYVVPVHQDLQNYHEAAATATPLRPPSNVSRPKARYPSASDSWPLHLLSSRSLQEEQHSGSSSSKATNGEEEDSDKA